MTLYGHEGQPLGEVRQSRSGRFYIRYLDGTCTPAKWRTATAATEFLHHEKDKST